MASATPSAPASAAAASVAAAASAAHIDSSIDGSCHRCGKPAPPARCAGCDAVSYCGRACQQEDWAVHRRYCKSNRRHVLKSVGRCRVRGTEADPSPEASPFRVVARRAVGWDVVAAQDIDEGTLILCPLIAYGDMGPTPDFVHMVRTSAYHGLVRALAYGLELPARTKPFVDSVVARAPKAAKRIRNMIIAMYFFGYGGNGYTELQHGVALMNHSATPNVGLAQTTTHAKVVYALRDIRAGESIRTCYWIGTQGPKYIVETHPAIPYTALELQLLDATPVADAPLRDLAPRLAAKPRVTLNELSALGRAMGTAGAEEAAWDAARVVLRRAEERLGVYVVQSHIFESSRKTNFNIIANDAYFPASGMEYLEGVLTRMTRRLMHAP